MPNNRDERAPTFDVTGPVGEISSRPDTDRNDEHVTKAIARQRRRWLPDNPTTFAQLTLAPLVDWMTPAFVRADLAAMSAHKCYKRLTASAFALPAFATLVVTLQVLFAAHRPWIAVFELLGLLAVVFVVWWGRRCRYHDRWIANRFLAERLRSMYFLAVCGVHRAATADGDSATMLSPLEDEIKRVIDATSASQPVVEYRPEELHVRRDYVRKYWIDDQLGYYQRTARSYARAEKGLHGTSTVLFGIAIAAAVVHLLSYWDIGPTWSSWESSVIAVSIGVPVVAAAFHGLRAQREYRRHAERYERMAKWLTELCCRMASAQSLAEVQRVARAVDRLTRNEHSDWFGAARFEDIEINA